MKKKDDLFSKSERRGSLERESMVDGVKIDNSAPG